MQRAGRPELFLREVRVKGFSTYPKLTLLFLDQLWINKATA